MPTLTAAKYGKDNIRVAKVDRDASNGTQTITEMTVCVLLEGEIDTSYVFHSLPSSPLLLSPLLSSPLLFLSLTNPTLPQL